MSGETITGFDPLIFKAYRKLAIAVLHAYEVDKAKEFLKLQADEKKLKKRLEFQKSTGIVKRWKNPEKALESFEMSKKRFEDFCRFEKTELFEMYFDIATACQNKEHHRLTLAEGTVKGKKFR